MNTEYEKIRNELAELPIIDCKPKWINKVYGNQNEANTYGLEQDYSRIFSLE
jgi:hypothetical protein